MSVLRLTTPMRAPIDRCFDLSRSIDLHVDSTAATGERAIAGVTRGLIGVGESVTWRARHLGVWLTLTSRVVAVDRPRHFRDSMVEGPFARFDHDHHFEEAPGGETLVHDTFDFASPLGPLGRLADRVFVDRYLTRFLAERNRVIKEAAESDAWRRYLAP